MKTVARFSKISFKQFEKDYLKSINLFSTNKISDEQLRKLYCSIRLPERSTKRSSGYDFFLPSHDSLFIVDGKTKLIPTGIRCEFLEDGYDLIMIPKSGLGLKYGMRLDNTLGLIDNDYFESGNEGHIWAAVTCDPTRVNTNTPLVLNPGDKFVQGVIREYFLAEEYNITEKSTRNGGFGSTGK